MTRLRAAAALAAGGLLVWLAPLAGLAAAGEGLARYLRFPPQAPDVVHAGFSWPVFGALSASAAAALVLFAAALWSAAPRRRPRERRPFPAWGWAGAALLGAGWALAWSPGIAPIEWRRQAFTAIWLGYIVVANALAWKRSGRSILTHRPALFLALFPLSAAFWWSFEYLNQFVGNWRYGGVEPGGEWSYFLQATVPFATVLPAIAGTWGWLRTIPRMEGMRLPPLRAPAGLAWASLAAGLGALAAIGLAPESLYSMLWLAPLLVLAGLQELLLGESLLAPLARGDWRPLLQPAAAALVCGFFWEMWNWGSLAQWHYSIPYVQRFQLFNMPLLGYAGYLPFGVECALVIDLAARLVEGDRMYAK